MQCLIQGMDRDFKPNGSYESLNLGEAGLTEAIGYLRRMPRRGDFPPELLGALKRGEDVCPPALILKGKFSLLISTEDGEKFDITTEDFGELSGYRFETEPGVLFGVEVGREEAEKIIRDFFRRVERIEGLGLSLSPLELSILTGIEEKMELHRLASILKRTEWEVENILRELKGRKYIGLKRKGIFGGEKFYELTRKGEETLREERGRVLRMAEEDREFIKDFAPLFLVMFALNMLPERMREMVRNAVGEPPS